jgi:regulator of replication initiation timing
MKSIVYITIFLLCIVLYIHIYYHLKVSDEENIFEIDYTDKVNLEEVCDLRQPFTMEIENTLNMKSEQLKSRLNIVHQKRQKEEKGTTENDDADKSDKNEDNDIVTKIYSEHNKEILSDETIQTSIKSFEKLIIPEFTIQNVYDILVSDDNFSTPFVSNFNHRNYLYFSEGNATIQFVSHKHNDKLEHHLDYELLQKVSTDVPSRVKGVTIKSINVKAGEFVYIPPRWWYSVNFKSRSLVVKFQYKTVMNIIAHTPMYIYSYITVAKAQEQKRMRKIKKKKEN